jgi:hypothetical protein
MEMKPKLEPVQGRMILPPAECLDIGPSQLSPWQRSNSDVSKERASTPTLDQTARLTKINADLTLDKPKVMKIFICGSKNLQRYQILANEDYVNREEHSIYNPDLSCRKMSPMFDNLPKEKPKSYFLRRPRPELKTIKQTSDLSITQDYCQETTIKTSKTIHDNNVSKPVTKQITFQRMPRPLAIRINNRKPSRLEFTAENYAMMKALKSIEKLAKTEGRQIERFGRRVHSIEPESNTF